MLKLNGNPININQGQTLQNILDAAGFNPEQVVAELNGIIVDRRQYVVTLLNDGDVLEVVTFVGGG